jgi:hypothetical protein
VKASTKVGAAMVDCTPPNGVRYSRILVVWYLPPGNVQGQYTQNVGHRR